MPRSKDREVALWAGVAAFFASLLSIGLFEILEPGKPWEFLGALIVSAITASAVYSKERLVSALKRKNGDKET